MRDYRRGLHTAGRLTRAEVYRTLGTVQFKKEHWKIALVGYLAGIWMLREGDPPCPKLLANHLNNLDDAPDALGPAYAKVEPDAVTLRTSLHLNLAAAALKVKEWRLARAACENILQADPKHPKALWRLAKAYEGDNNLTEAMVAARKLVANDPSNMDGEKLLANLQARKAKYGKMFHSFVERAHEEGDTLYTKREQERDVSGAMQKGFVQCMGRPYPGEEVPPPAPDLPEGIQEDKNDNGDSIFRNEAGEEIKISEAEMWEHHARHHAANRKVYNDDELACNRAMGGAYNKTKAWREAGVLMSLPPKVTASEAYVDLDLTDKCELVRKRLGYDENLPLREIVERAEADLGVDERGPDSGSLVTRVDRCRQILKQYD